MLGALQYWIFGPGGEFCWRRIGEKRRLSWILVLSPPPSIIASPFVFAVPHFTPKITKAKSKSTKKTQLTYFIYELITHSKSIQCNSCPTNILSFYNPTSINFFIWYWIIELPWPCIHFHFVLCVLNFFYCLHLYFVFLIRSIYILSLASIFFIFILWILDNLGFWVNPSFHHWWLAQTGPEAHWPVQDIFWLRSFSSLTLL